MQNNKTGILLSGGMDSIAVAYWKKPQLAFTINYGHAAALSEIHAASQVAKELGIEHHVVTVDCSNLGSGDLNNSKALSIAPVTEWWPYRNQLLITLACMKGLSLEMKELFVGSVSSDDMHKDGSQPFYEKISDLMKYQEENIKKSSPAIKMNTIELIKTIGLPESLLFWAHSCHTSNQPCMNCNGCKKYLFVLQQIGLD